VIRRALFAVSAVVVLGLAIAACGGSSSDSSSTGSSGTTTESSGSEQKTVGVALLATVDVLEENIDAFKQQLTAEGVDAKFEDFNAEGQISNVNSIVTRLTQLNPDLVYLVGTPFVETYLKVDEETPIIFGAMSDPLGVGAVKSLDHPGGNATGTTATVPPQDTFKLIEEVVPDLKTLGVIGNTAEENTVQQISELEEVAKEKGVKLEKRSVANTGEVASAIRSLEDVEALVVPNDNTVASALPTVAQTCVAGGLPCVQLGGATIVEEGFPLSLGADFTVLGEKAGIQAAEVLAGKSPAEIPVFGLEGEQGLEYGVNFDVARELGIEIPTSLRESASVTVGKP
jgi:putative tryptophan/tyrosine transport system substrate-binding protein